VRKGSGPFLAHRFERVGLKAEEFKIVGAIWVVWTGMAIGFPPRSESEDWWSPDSDDPLLTTSRATCVSLAAKPPCSATLALLPV